jgi:hypothetical protein
MLNRQVAAGVEPDAPAYNAAISAHLRADDVGRALKQVTSESARVETARHATERAEVYTSPWARRR